ncbi:hypothetical protein ACQCN2_20190 [Brevibacillus ginsengisoli]|uniref:hypothetical protein n=1 Tax=Brevibacillus ginsengisoli TaxID=363854 RepID=UPI003CF9C71A
MTGYTLIFLLSTLLLLILIPIFISKDIKKQKKPTEIFTSNIMYFILLAVSAGEVVKTFLSPDTMKYFNQVLFCLVILLVILPLLVILFLHFKEDKKKWENPNEYKYEWAYRFRHILFVILTCMLLASFYKLYEVYEVVFHA